MIAFSFSTGFLFEKKKKCEHGFDALVLLDGDGQHDPGEIPKLLVPITNDAADIVIGFRSFGQMPAYRRLGRAVLDRATGVGGAVTDSQCGFRALNRKAIELLSGTLEKDDFAVESDMTRLANDQDLRFADVEINCKYGDFKTSTRNPVSHGVGVLNSSLGYCCFGCIIRMDISRLRMRCWYRFL